MEKNKLFVRNIGFETTQDEVEALFRPHPSLREVRLVTFRNGHSKGCAYVEFETEEAASKALLATDGKEFKGKPLSVEISRPPPRKGAQPGPSLGAGVALGSRGKGRSQLSFVPRAVAATTSGNGANGSSAGAAVPKSNADFRSMLLKK